jgi:hypothetical protein
MRLLRELARVLDAVGDVRGLVEVLARQVGLCADDERAAVLLRMGRLLETRWPSRRLPPTRTCGPWRPTPSRPRRSRAWSGCWPPNSVRQEDLAKVAARLLPYYELTERFDKWAGMLEALVSVTEDRGERRAHLELLADLYQGPLADAAAAFGAVLRVFEMDPANLSVRERLVQLGADAGKLPVLAEAARRVLTAAEEPISAARDPNAHRRGRGAAAGPQERGRSGPACGAAAGSLHMGAYRALARLVRDAERWAALRDLIEAREQHLPDVKERLGLLWQAVEIDEALLYDRDHATEVLRRIVAVGSD